MVTSETVDGHDPPAPPRRARNGEKFVTVFSISGR